MRFIEHNETYSYYGNVAKLSKSEDLKVTGYWYNAVVQPNAVNHANSLTNNQSFRLADVRSIIFIWIAEISSVTFIVALQWVVNARHHLENFSLNKKLQNYDRKQAPKAQNIIPLLIDHMF